MKFTGTELKKYIADDIRKYSGVRRPLKASIMERMTVSKLPPKKLHPNPEDEFTWPEVGPCERIISEYIKELTDNDHFKKPIMVEKMFPDGYELINGHHRWAAAMRCGKNLVGVKIVNLTHEDDILKMIEQSKRSMRVAFDLDEVLLVTDASTPAEPGPSFPYNRLFKERLRVGVKALFNDLHQLGFDIWVYTRTVLSEEEIRRLFRAYGLELDGCINGVGARSGKQKREKPSSAFAGKYKLNVHVDNESIIFTEPKVRGYDMVDLDAKDYDWVIRVLQEIRAKLAADTEGTGAPANRTN